MYFWLVRWTFIYSFFGKIVTIFTLLKIQAWFQSLDTKTIFRHQDYTMGYWEPKIWYPTSSCVVARILTTCACGVNIALVLFTLWHSSHSQRLIIESTVISVTEIYPCVCLFFHCVGVKCARCDCDSLRR